MHFGGQSCLKDSCYPVLALHELLHGAQQLCTRGTSLLAERHDVQGLAAPEYHAVTPGPQGP